LNVIFSEPKHNNEDGGCWNEDDNNVLKNIKAQKKRGMPVLLGTIIELFVKLQMQYVKRENDLFPYS
jgi:hypothetical protein